MNLPIALRSEILKTKRTAALYFTLIGAAVVPFMFLLTAITHDLPDWEKSSKDPLNVIFHIFSEMNGITIFPLYVVLLCTLLPQIEYKNNTWKQVLTSPKTKRDIFAAKFLNVLLLTVLFQVASHLFMWLVVIAIHFLLPAIQVLHQPFDASVPLIKAANSWICVLAICSVQFWIGLRCKNFLVPIAIGLVLWLTGTLLVFEYHSSMANYFPFSFHTFPFSAGLQPALTQVVWSSLGCAVFVLFVGYLDFSRRRMNG